MVERAVPARQVVIELAVDKVEAHMAGRPCHSGFDFTAQMRVVCSDMIGRIPELGHIDLRRVAISFSQARKRVQHGMFASLTPLRFENGADTGDQHGQRWRVQKLCDEEGREMLYVLRFYLPRFMDLEFKEKLVTILHELWHISPDFNGDLRRHPGRCYVHSRSQDQYDARMAELAEDWLALSPPRDLIGFLNLPFDELRKTYGRVVGLRIRQPKLIPVSDGATRP